MTSERIMPALAAAAAAVSKRAIWLADAAALQRPDHRRSSASPDHPQTIDVVHVLIAAEATEDRLAKQSRHRVLAVLAGTRIDQLIASHVRQRVIKLTVGEQSAIGGDPGTVELKLQAAVKIEPQREAKWEIRV